jgi:hypothetical protein
MKRRKTKAEPELEESPDVCCGVCGCTENDACDGGCQWDRSGVTMTDVCDRCTSKMPFRVGSARGVCSVVGPGPRRKRISIVVGFNAAETRATCAKLNRVWFMGMLAMGLLIDGRGETDRAAELLRTAEAGNG